jgi:hypothetical protein
VPRRVAAETIFASLIAAFIGALALAGCSMQQTQAERPNWSLNGPDRRISPAPQPAKHYSDWNGPNAPKPLTNDTAQ